MKEKTLTENLKEWRKNRNITNPSYINFVENILEEILEPIYDKNTTDIFKKRIMKEYFPEDEWLYNHNTVIDTIKDIKVYCINEAELMGYDDVKTDNEVFQEINSREQDPQQLAEWQKHGANGKWQKSLLPEHIEKWYKADYNKCKLLT